MPPSFLAYVAQRHGFKFEDVATDALTFVLQNSPSAREELRATLNGRITDLLPPHYSVETRRKIAGDCIPDVILRDPNDTPCVIIEAKFTAALTDCQPGRYLDYLEAYRQGDRATLLVFMVPESRLHYYRERIAERCGRRTISWGGSNTTASRSFIHVMSWAEALQILKRGEATLSQFGMFLLDLERMCQLAEPDKYKPLTVPELAELASRDNTLAVRTRNFMDLAGEIAKATFGGTQKEWSKFTNAWGSTWSGTYGSIAGFEAWIGVDAGAWSEWGGSPIWLQLMGRSRLQQIEMRLYSLKRDVGYFLHSNGEQLCIPIFLGNGTREEVLQQGCAQIEKIVLLLTSATSQNDPCEDPENASKPYYSIISEPVKF